MKLKKIASLMLAGVMAVSMLAGCSNGGSTENPEEPATGVNATTVIAALSKDTTKNVTFTTSATLQAVAEKAAGYVSAGVVSTFDASLLEKVDSNIVTDAKLKQVDTSSGSAATDKEVQTATFIVDSSDLMGASAEATAKKLASKIDAAQVEETSNNTLSKLPTESKEYEDSNTSEKYKFEFAYNVEMAVVSVTNTGGQATYYAVCVLTRTPTRVAVEA